MTKMDWQKARARGITFVPPKKSPRSQAKADRLAEIIETVKTKKLAGEWVELPSGLSKFEKRLVWARALSELNGQRKKQRRTH